MPLPGSAPPPPLAPSSPARGLACMVTSCMLFAAMGGLVYHVQLREPEASVLVSSFVRIVVNLALLVAWGLATGTVRALVGDRRPSLWWRGVFGSLSLMTSFAAMRAIGIGEAAFLTASNGIFVAALAPFVLRQPNTAKAWVAIAGAVIGLWLLLEPRIHDASPWGRVLAIVSGACGACAYLMIARAGRSNSPDTVIFYFCLVATALHLAVFAAVRPTLPSEAATWAWLVAAGVFGSVAQVFLTKAYQTAPAALNSAVGYVGPVINLAVSVAVFDKHPDARALAGATIVLGFGVVLPFVRVPKL